MKEFHHIRINCIIYCLFIGGTANMKHEVIQLMVHSLDAIELYLKSVEEVKKNNWNKANQLINEGGLRLVKAQKVREVIVKSDNFEELEQSINFTFAIKTITSAEKIKNNVLILSQACENIS